MATKTAASDSLEGIEPKARGGRANADRDLDGVFYTPPAVARHMARETLLTLIEQRTSLSSDAATVLVRTRRASHLSKQDAALIERLLSEAKIIDPACGAGALLLAVLDEVREIVATLKRHLGVKAAHARVQNDRPSVSASLYGVDIDARAVACAADRICAAGGSIATRTNLIVGDALLGGSPAVPEDAAPPLIRPCDREISTPGDADGADGIHWRTRFPEAFARGGFDIVIMNPPYVATYARRSKRDRLPHLGSLKKRYGGIGGRLNLFTCFLQRGLELLNPDGVCCCIAPDTLAMSDSYAAVRGLIARRLPRQRWTLLTPAVFDAQVRSVIVTAGPGRPSVQTRIVDDLDTLDVSESTGGDERDGRDDGRHCVRFLRTSLERRIWSVVARHEKTLADLFITRDGVNPGPRRVRERIVDPVNPDGALVRPLITGSDLDSRGYVVKPPTQTILYDPAILNAQERSAGASLRDPAVFDAPKIVSRQTADTIIAAIDMEAGFVTLNSVHCTWVIDGSNDLLWGLLALLNSPLARLFYALDGGETRDLLPQVHISWLRRLPLPPNARQILATLAPHARTLWEGFDDDKTRRKEQGAIHGAVCERYGLSEGDAKGVLDAYLHRYPRYATDWEKPHSGDQGEHLARRPRACSSS